jgi:hypothetical protein
MAATRYGIMMLRFASTKAAFDKFRRPIEYPKIKYVYRIVVRPEPLVGAPG